MDTFQGNLKIQPYDCRYFAAFYLVLRMVNLSVLIWTRSGLYFYLSGYIFIFATLVVAAFRPYPKMRHTIVDIVLLSSVSLASFWYSVFFTASILDPSHCAGKKSLIASGLLVSLPAIYAVLFHLHKMLPRLLVIKLKALINQSRDASPSYIHVYTYAGVGWHGCARLLRDQADILSYLVSPLGHRPRYMHKRDKYK